MWKADIRLFKWIPQNLSKEGVQSFNKSIKWGNIFFFFFLKNREVKCTSILSKMVCIIYSYLQLTIDISVIYNYLQLTIDISGQLLLMHLNQQILKKNKYFSLVKVRLSYRLTLGVCTAKLLVINFIQWYYNSNLWPFELL